MEYKINLDLNLFLKLTESHLRSTVLVKLVSPNRVFRFRFVGQGKKRKIQIESEKRIRPRDRRPSFLKHEKGTNWTPLSPLSNVSSL